MTDLTLEDLLGDLSPEEIARAVRSMTPEEAQSLLDATEEQPLLVPDSPLGQAKVLDGNYRTRDHLQYLSDRLSAAVAKVEQGESQFIAVSMPPRSGKSQLTSVYLPAWLLHKHPEWPIGLISHDPTLATNWGRDVRALVEERADVLGIKLRRDAGAVTDWKTTEDGGVLSRSVRQSITGRGFKVLIVDDAVKDYADAHSAANREWLWNWWKSNASTRQNGPWLVVFIGTRWHEDDVIGRLLSSDHEGDPDQWEQIVFPAIAEDADVLGRAPGEPLLSPLMEETPEEALARWATVKASVGIYAWDALYQQRPSPAKGSVFNSDWWRFWTIYPSKVSKGPDGKPDGKVVLLDPDADLRGARWLDSWDMAFKATSASDYVVAGRWAQVGALRYLMYQERERRTFTETLTRMKIWCDHSDPTTPWAHHVHERLVEDKANGTAVLDTLKEQVSGLIPINPTDSKEARARAVTPEVEAGNVLLPNPGDPGNEWVQELLSELRGFPNGAHDDQVDQLTQALSRMRTPTKSSVTVPGRVTQLVPRTRSQVALSIDRRYSERRITR